MEWARGVVKVFEEEGIAKGAAAVTFNGKMVDTPVYDNARTILATVAEIAAFDAKRPGLGPRVHPQGAGVMREGRPSGRPLLGMGLD